MLSVKENRAEDPIYILWIPPQGWNPLLPPVRQTILNLLFSRLRPDCIDSWPWHGRQFARPDLSDKQSRRD